ncbi:hypothetical protein EhVM1_000082 [Emiliania huxleyi virus M1]|nr:hypothetical protein EhVM1_000082 [Emiliania huxleyi virus M1]
METRDYIIVGLSVALTLTLVAVIIVLVNGKAQLENPRFDKDEIMDEVNRAINNGEVVVPNVFGINAEVKRRRAIADASRLSDQLTYDMSAEFRDL